MSARRARAALLPAMPLPAILLLASLATTGCESLGVAPRKLPLPHFNAGDAAFAGVRRVCVLGFRSDDGVTADTARVHDAFARELAKLHRFQLVPLPGGAPEGEVIHDAVARRRAATGPLSELVDRYGVDAVVLGTVTADRPYPPQHLGLRVRLVSLLDGRTLWSVDAIYDAGDARVQEDCQHYARSFQSEERSMHDWEMNLLSPQRFTDYVVHRVCGTLR